MDPRNIKAPCMENGICTKRYPKDFMEMITIDQNEYPIYRRCNQDQFYMIGSHKVNNRDILPYNPCISKMFNYHSNIEVYARMRCVKYIHKYIYKGPDRTTMVLEWVDEIQQYLDARYIEPIEATWRLLSNSMHEEFPLVVQLAIHLPGMHKVVYDPNESVDRITSRATQQVLTLIGFFNYCAANPSTRVLYTYLEFSNYFVWNSKTCVWTPRKKGVCYW